MLNRIHMGRQSQLIIRATVDKPHPANVRNDTDWKSRNWPKTARPINKQRFTNASYHLVVQTQIFLPQFYHR